MTPWGKFTSLRRCVKQSPMLRTLTFLFQNGIHAVAPTEAKWSAADEAGAREHFLVAAVRAKNEARFLPEWIAHHLQHGIEHFYVYDNNSEDDLRGAIRPFLDAGLATYVPWPVVPASPSYLRDFMTRFSSRCQWLALFDVDEFVSAPGPETFVDVLRRHGSHPALAINFRYFGSSGYEKIPTGLVTENFAKADVMPDDHVKVVLQPRHFHRYRNAHNLYYCGGRLARDCHGRKVFGSFNSPQPDPALVLHHYVYRSREDYAAKVRRGFSTTRGSIDGARRAAWIDREFVRHNDVVVPQAEAVLGRTRATLRQFGYGAPYVRDAPMPEPAVR